MCCSGRLGAGSSSSSTVTPASARPLALAAAIIRPSLAASTHQNTLSLLYFTSDSYIIVKDYQQGAAWIIYQNNAWPSSFLAVRLRFSDAKMKEYADKAEELGAMLATEV
ncbi:hypothetical protein BDA96_02G116100 [Sorghum bicolor]|uniref:Uncharacterized protein n=1 Tax=Sorghum bicolor TaxID=4558 RepID=A0A921USC1_SORBI|nr:hypothetical protein BDA96_02G116100 [Sorghum bicolor]